MSVSVITEKWRNVYYNGKY